MPSLAYPDVLRCVLLLQVTSEGGIEAARYYREEIGRRMEEARQSIDRLESLTAAEYWPYPTYADILFSV